MLYGSAKIWLNDLDKSQQRQLHKLSLLSRDLYNLSMRTISEHYAITNEILDFQRLKALIKERQEYVQITGFYYAVCLSAAADFKKYINTNSYIKDKSKHTLALKNLTDFRPPLSKDFYPIMLLKVSTANGYIMLPKTKLTDEIKLKLPLNYQCKSISKITIRLLFNKCWQMIVDYHVEQKPQGYLDKSKAMGIDLGVSNFATCAVTNGDCYIIDGKYLKGILQGYCKYKAKITSSNGGRYNTKRLVSLHRRTHNRIDDYVRKSVNYIIRYCIENNIGQIFLGWGLHFQTFDIGTNNQMYSLFPFARFSALLGFKCKQYGIAFRTIDECFTSQASFLDNDPMPEHITNVKQNFSGKRRYRGLYISKDGRKINADVNGAFNILRKGNAVITIDLCGRWIATPMRINPLKD